MVESAQNDVNQFVVVEINDWGFDENDDILLLMCWEGYGTDDDTWEHARDLVKCAGRVVRAYIRVHKGENVALAALLKELSKKKD